MDLSPQAEEIKTNLEKYLTNTQYCFNNDLNIINKVLNGLAKRQEKTGRLYCPCRLVSGDEEKDKKIECPCVYHEKEIETKGICHCQLLIKKI